MARPAHEFTAEPKLDPPRGIPPIRPLSTVSIIFSRPSSAATEDTASGIPIPRFTTELSSSSRTALLAISFLSFRYRGLKPYLSDLYLPAIIGS